MSAPRPDWPGVPLARVARPSPEIERRGTEKEGGREEAERLCDLPAARVPGPRQPAGSCPRGPARRERQLRQPWLQGQLVLRPLARRIRPPRPASCRCLLPDGHQPRGHPGLRASPMLCPPRVCPQPCSLRTKAASLPSLPEPGVSYQERGSLNIPAPAAWGESLGAMPVSLSPWPCEQPGRIPLPRCEYLKVASVNESQGDCILPLRRKSHASGPLRSSLFSLVYDSFLPNSVIVAKRQSRFVKTVL